MKTQIMSKARVACELSLVVTRSHSLRVDTPGPFAPPPSRLRVLLNRPDGFESASAFLRSIVRRQIRVGDDECIHADFFKLTFNERSFFIGRGACDGKRQVYFNYALQPFLLKSQKLSHLFQNFFR